MVIKNGEDNGELENLRNTSQHWQILTKLKVVFRDLRFSTSMEYNWRVKSRKSGVMVSAVHSGSSSPSLRSKRSRTKRTKFGSREGVFRIRAARKMGREQKKWKEGVGEGTEGNLLSLSFPSFPSPTPFLPPFCPSPIFRTARMWKTPSRDPNFVRFVRERLLRRLVKSRKSGVMVSAVHSGSSGPGSSPG